MSAATFVEAVAARCGRATDEVTRVLTSSHIPLNHIPATPHRLRVTRLMFEGTKMGVTNPGPFRFEQAFGDGVWALVSERNEAGKSSVMEIIVWVLRGEPRSGGLQEDVHQWITRVELDGTIDGQGFAVEFDMDDGQPTGTLRSGTWHVDFAGDHDFHEHMSDFMMDRLGLATFQGWQSDVGRVTQGWNTYTTTLYFPRDAMSAVIGTTVQAGLAARLLLLFVGVPWSETYLACQTADKQVRESTTKQRAADDTVRVAADAALRAIEDQIAGVTEQLSLMPDTSQAITDMHTASATYASLIAAYSSLERKLADARSEARRAKSNAKDERKKAQDVNEARRAQRLFHGMAPTVCPRCSTEIDDERIAHEKDHDTCSVCARDLELEEIEPDLDDDDVDEGDDDDADAQQEDHEVLDARATLMEGFAAEAEQRVDELSGQLTEVRQQRDGAEAALNALREQASGGEDRAALELLLVQLQARAEQLRALTAVPVVPAADDGDGDNAPAIIAAALAEADKRVKDGFADIVTDLNAEILALGQRFGIDALQSVEINRATHLKIRKGDADTSYGKCTPGERLRLRLAVVIAMLRVADQHHVGRHPGLLMIDSLGAEETEAGNLSQFMGALAEVTDELGIETITASARDTSAGEDPILAHVPADHAVVVTGTDPLW